MNQSTLSECLDAIHDEATTLLRTDLTSEQSAIVERIIALSRYKFDVRSDDEKSK